MVAHRETGFLIFDEPRRREAAWRSLIEINVGASFDTYYLWRWQAEDEADGDGR